MKNELQVGFVLLSREDAPIPSTRIAVLNMFPFLRQANIEPVVIYQPNFPTEEPDVSGLRERIITSGIKIVVFQKVHGPSVELLVQELHEVGIKTVYCVCDLVEVGMATTADATIVVTDYLKSLYPPVLQKKIYVIHDGIEHPECRKFIHDDNSGSRFNPLKAVLVTSAALDHLPAYFPLPDWLSITIIGRYPDNKHWLQRIHEARWNIMRKKTIKNKFECLRFYTNRQIKAEAWSTKKVYDQLGVADIGIIPIDSNDADPADAAWRVKSENRLTMKMAFGLPVIASPIPSYEPVIIQGKNGFLAHSRADWMSYLTALRDPKLRTAIGAKARQSVIDRFSMEKQAGDFIRVLMGLV